MYCSNCGNAVPVGTNFCPTCGAPQGQGGAETHQTPNTASWNDQYPPQPDHAPQGGAYDGYDPQGNVPPAGGYGGYDPGNAYTKGGYGYQGRGEAASTGTWFARELVGRLPLVGLIVLLVWAFSGEEDLARRNWARGNLLVSLAWLALISLALFDGLLSVFDLFF